MLVLYTMPLKTGDEMPSFKQALLKLICIRKNVKVGKNFHVGPGSVIWAPRSLDIGDDVYIGKNATIEIDGKIGDGVLIANTVGVVGRTDHDMREMGVTVRNSRWVGNYVEDLSVQTVIGSDVWIGYGAIILSGVTVGDSAIVAAGSVVTTDVAPNSIVAGCPANAVGARFAPDDYKQHWAELHKKGVRRLCI